MGAIVRAIVLAAVLIAGNVIYMMPVESLRLNNRSLKLTSSQPNTVTTYLIEFSYETSYTLGSIKIDFCSNSALPNDGCTAPAGLDLTQLTLTQSGETGFTVDSTSSPNTIILSRTPTVRTEDSQSLKFDQITNPSSNGTYFTRIYTFASSDATGPYDDYGAMVFYMNNLITIKAEVPPYLIFCAAKTISGQDCTNIDGSTVDFNEFSPRSANTATSQFQVTANAGDGYNIRVAGPTLTSGNDIIAALSANAGSAPGTSQFGLNLKANTSPRIGRESQGGAQGQPVAAYGIPNSFRYVPGEVIASAPRNDASELFTVSYLVNIPPSQAPGIYVTTLTYICLANF